MGRSAPPVVPASAATPSVQNPVSGIFGAGKVRFITISQTFTVPPGVYKVRARLWGAGSMGGTAGGTSSFGSFVSATGGSADGFTGGNGIGGDVNNQGGAYSGSGTPGGGGAASLLGPGGSPYKPARGGAGAGGTPALGRGHGQNGFTGKGGLYTYSSSGTIPGQGEQGRADILDYIGTGGGGATGDVLGSSQTYAADGANGGGGGGSNSNNNSYYGGRGGFPGGGHGDRGAGGGFAMKEIDVTPGQQITVTVGATPDGNGGHGLVVVEY